MPRRPAIELLLRMTPDFCRIMCGSAYLQPLAKAIEKRARVGVEVMEPFRQASPPPNIDATFLRNHGAQAAASLGLALRSPGDKFE